MSLWIYPGLCRTARCDHDENEKIVKHPPPSALTPCACPEDRVGPRWICTGNGEWICGVCGTKTEVIEEER